MYIFIIYIYLYKIFRSQLFSAFNTFLYFQQFRMYGHCKPKGKHFLPPLERGKSAFDFMFESFVFTQLLVKSLVGDGRSVADMHKGTLTIKHPNTGTFGE